MSRRPSLRIIIVNWNSREQTRDCIRAVATAARKDNFIIEQVVVVDNASQDGSATGLEEEFTPYAPEMPLRVIRNRENLGFGAACNQGAIGTAADYILLLNPDTIAYKDSLSVPMAFMERPENQQIGILGIRLIDDTGEVSRCCARFPTPVGLVGRALGLDMLLPRIFPPRFMKEWNHNDSRAVDLVMGAFFLVRTEVWKSLQGMDERFFVYLEDMDFAFRAKQAGWMCYYYNDASIYHKGGGTSEQVKATRLAYSLFSRIQYARKHFSPTGAFLTTGTVMLLEPITRTLLALLRRRPAEIGETAKAYALIRSALRRQSIRPVPATGQTSAQERNG